LNQDAKQIQNKSKQTKHKPRNINTKMDSFSL